MLARIVAHQLKPTDTLNLEACVVTAEFASFVGGKSLKSTVKFAIDARDRGKYPLGACFTFEPKVQQELGLDAPPVEPRKPRAAKEA